MATMSYATEQAATDRNRALWVGVLGRSKRSDDVTEFAYTQEGTNLLVDARSEISDTMLRRQDLMTAAEVAALIDLYAAWSGSLVAYAVGDIRSYDGTLYKCVQAHTSQANWQPSAVPALWTPCAPAGVIPAWVQPTGAQDAYALDAQVTHNTRVWKSLKAANTDQPGVVGTWRDQSNPPLWVQPSGSIGLWQVNDVASYQGHTWRCTSANNSFVPGVFGWTQIS